MSSFVWNQGSLLQLVLGLHKEGDPFHPTSNSFSPLFLGDETQNCDSAGDGESQENCDGEEESEAEEKKSNSAGHQISTRQIRRRQGRKRRR